MKKDTLLLAVVIFILIWLLVPFFLMGINFYLNFLIIDIIFLKILGGLLILLAVVLTGHTFWLFSKNGQGTPVPTEAPKKFVVKGLYQYARNPMYWGYMASFLGMFFVFGSILLFGYFLLSILALHLYVTKLEEPILKKRFGQSYLDYCAKIPRWRWKNIKANS